MNFNNTNKTANGLVLGNIQKVTNTSTNISYSTTSNVNSVNTKFNYLQVSIYLNNVRFSTNQELYPIQQQNKHT